MSTNCQFCGCSSHAEGFHKGCTYCAKYVNNAILCPDPLCGKPVLPKDQGKSDFVCNCKSDHWQTLRFANATQPPIPDRKCSGCGSACKKNNGISMGFCDTHIKSKPKVDELQYCSICGTNENVFAVVFPVAVCTKSECRATLSSHKF